MDFKNLKIGDEFDWIGGEYPSFFLRCVKTGKKTYVDTTNTLHIVGSVNAQVYNVKRPSKMEN